MTAETDPVRMTPVGGSWWAAYEDENKVSVVPIIGFDQHGAPYVWSVQTHSPVPAVRTAFVAVVSDSYRGEYGELIGAAIRSANGGHRGEAFASPSGHPAAHADGAADAKDTIRAGIEKARDVIHDATGPGR
jgi:hypothetical protein